ncbi:MAG: acetate--CoA ligase [Candidatus Marinimicrobia bacterium]|nr:acetate--CoA ligase [Candidatus Neomarinimicrobiota bacterium]
MPDHADSSSVLDAEHVIKPPAEFSAQAHASDDSIYAAARKDRLAFWANQAEELHWFRKWDQILDWDEPDAKWFVGGTTNIAYNCLDRHILTWRRTKAAIIWEGELGDQRVLTYYDLHREVCKFANVLQATFGVKEGDRVTIYMPMIPELAVAMLACTRIGAAHSIIFAGFSAEAISDRVKDCGSKLIITADGGYRNGKIIALKNIVDAAISAAGSPVKDVIIVRHIGDGAALKLHENRDHWYHRLMEGASAQHEAAQLDSEALSFLLYTSGTTGEPKGIMHTTGGYLTGVTYTSKYVFDLKSDDVFWCTADIGWITGHSYIIYGPLSNGATTLMYEGAPGYPDKDRFWSIIAKHGVTIFYTAPTAIRTFMSWGDDFPRRHDLSSLRLLGTVGEPINPKAWKWYHKVIGSSHCPIVDTWWQTETGNIMISPLPGITATKPGSATHPLPGIEAEIVDENGAPVARGAGGLLIITSPWPAMLRGIYGDPERFKEVYWSRFPGNYFTGDGAQLDKDGYFWILGRVDDVINVSGHRLGTMEIESACVDHPAVSEAAAIGIDHEIKGSAIVVFVSLTAAHAGNSSLGEAIRQHVAAKIGAFARPEKVIITQELPKTRSGKIMRRLLRDIAEGKAIGDTTTLADSKVIDRLKAKYEQREG